MLRRLSAVPLLLSVLVVFALCVPAPPAASQSTPALAENSQPDASERTRYQEGGANEATTPKEPAGPAADSPGERAFYTAPAVLVAVVMLAVLVALAQRHLFRRRRSSRLAVGAD